MATPTAASIGASTAGVVALLPTPSTSGTVSRSMSIGATTYNSSVLIFAAITPAPAAIAPLPGIPGKDQPGGASYGEWYRGQWINNPPRYEVECEVPLAFDVYASWDFDEAAGFVHGFQPDEPEPLPVVQAEKVQPREYRVRGIRVTKLPKCLIRS